MLPGELQIPIDKVDRLLDAADGDACLLFLYILRKGGRMSLEEAGEELRLGERVAAAAEKLRELGLISSPGGGWKAKTQRAVPEPPAVTVVPPPVPPAREPDLTEDRLPGYTSEEMQAVSRSDPVFHEMIGEVERLLGTILTQNGLEAFTGFYDHLGLPPDVIVMMTGYCVEHMGKPGADGRVRGPGIQALRREAYRWADNDIRDLKAAGEYVKRKEEARALKARYRVLLGLTGRAPSQTEERCLTEWSEAGYPEELLQEAYDRTTQKTGRLVWKYMDTILKSWEKQGLKTLEAVQAGDRHPRRQETAEGEGAAPGDYERMKKYLDSLKES